MSRKKKSVAGRLFYTFGSIFLAAVVTVCTMNFMKDGRVFQAHLLSSATEASANQGDTDTAKTSQDYETIKVNSSKTTSNTSTKTSSGTASKTSSANKSEEDKETAASGSAAQPPVVAEP